MLSIKAQRPPSCGLWQHEIKQDGFRVIARKDGDRVKLDRIRHHRHNEIIFPVRVRPDRAE